MPHPRLAGKNLYKKNKKNIYSACNPMQMVVFWKNILFLQSKHSNFLTLNVAKYLNRGSGYVIKYSIITYGVIVETPKTV